MPQESLLLRSLDTMMWTESVVTETLWSHKSKPKTLAKSHPFIGSLIGNDQPLIGCDQSLLQGNQRPSMKVSDKKSFLPQNNQHNPIVSKADFVSRGFVCELACF